MFHSKKLWQMIDSIVLNIPHSSSVFPGTAKTDGKTTSMCISSAGQTGERTACSGWPHPWIPAFIRSSSPGQDSSAMWSVWKTIRWKKSVRHCLFIFRRNREEHYRNRNHLQVILPWAQGCRHQGADAVFDTDRLPLVSFRPVRRGSMHRLQR